MALLGCIADDFTGGTDLANNLVKSGFRTVQTIGIPENLSSATATDAVVVALKTRTCGAAEAVAESRRALGWLRSLGCKQFYFKYCSTFDSTPRGNIGPVIEGLLEELGESFTIACPAFPDNGRTMYRGHLFVHDQLLNESGMQNHPLTPMTDANIVRVLSAQTRLAVGLIRLGTVHQGEQSVRESCQGLRKEGIAVAVTDATSNHDLLVLSRSVRQFKLVTGGSGLALGLGENFGLRGSAAAKIVAPAGRRAILAGSCSGMTLRQIEQVKTVYPSFRVQPLELANGFDEALKSLVNWITEHQREEPVMIYSSATPSEVALVQRSLGAGQAGELCERFLGAAASALVERQTTQLIVAGGETSGTVVNTLGLKQLQIGPEIDPGVPWTLASGKKNRLALALKSGNFGSERFFLDAWKLLS